MITFSRGRHLYQIYRAPPGAADYVGLRDGRVVLRGPSAAAIAALLICQTSDSRSPRPARRQPDTEYSLNIVAADDDEDRGRGD